MRKHAVLYHANCYDGFGAAFVAWKKFGNDRADYFPVQHGPPPPKDLFRYQHIYILDFSYSAEEIVRLAVTRPEGGAVFVLDHHKTAEAELSRIDLKEYRNLRIQFDMNRSGAMLTLNHFFPGETSRLIEYVQDRDLWKFELPRSREFTMYLRSLPMDFAEWSALSSIVDGPDYGSRGSCPPFVDHGAAILRYTDMETDRAVERGNRIKVLLMGHQVDAVNAHMLFSEIADALCGDNTFGVTFRHTSAGVTVSLRSRTSFDVSVVAKFYGGGGHKAAAGFVIPAEQWAELCV